MYAKLLEDRTHDDSPPCSCKRSSCRVSSHSLDGTRATAGVDDAEHHVVLVRQADLLPVKGGDGQGRLFVSVRQDRPLTLLSVRARALASARAGCWIEHYSTRRAQGCWSSCSLVGRAVHCDTELLFV